MKIKSSFLNDSKMMLSLSEEMSFVYFINISKPILSYKKEWLKNTEIKSIGKNFVLCLFKTVQNVKSPEEDPVQG